MIKFIIFLLLIISSSLVAQTNKSLPIYQGIVDDVKFWEKVFSEYKSDQYIYHDTSNLNIIYDVKTVDNNSKRRRELADGQKEHIIQALSAMSRTGKPTTNFQKRILANIPKDMQNKEGYKQLSHRVRYQRGVADNFKISLERSQKYLPTIKKEIKKIGLPIDLAYLPHLESGFNVKARSKAGAVGIWQLMPAKAREAGLKVNKTKDERYDLDKSTRLALKSIKRYYDATGTWGLALTSYNYGFNGTMRAIKKFETNDYVTIRENHQTRIFGFASKNFYPSFLAVRNLALKHEAQLAQAKKQAQTLAINE